LLPGIILHFSFDVVWFALPIFLAKAPGIWFQQLMVVVCTLVPLWVVLWRRVQVGSWTELPASLLNAAWTPPPAAERRAELPAHPRAQMPRGTRTAWLAAGAVGLLVLLVTLAMRSDDPFGSLPIGRSRAEALAREELQQRGVTLSPKWRVMAVPDDGSGGPHPVVFETAGDARWRELLGVYLPKPRWRVRVATFTGDIVDRAEEWQMYVNAAGEVRGVRHTLPEGRPGAALDESSARKAALDAVRARIGLGDGQLKEVSAKPAKQKARTDWTFTFTDTTIVALPKGEPRIDVTIAGDEVTSVSRYVYVPEDWEREQRAASTRNLIVQIATGVVFGGLLLAAAIAGMVAWSRGEYAPRYFLAATVLVLLVSLVGLANGWPAVIAALPTAAPLAVQLLGVVAGGPIGVRVIAGLIGLAIGALPRPLARLGALPDRDAIRLAVAAGLVGAAAAVVAAMFRTPEWARAPTIAPLGTVVPFVDQALSPVSGFLTRTTIVMAALVALDKITVSWTERRAFAIAAVGVVGVLSRGGPSAAHFSRPGPARPPRATAPPLPDAPPPPVD